MNAIKFMLVLALIIVGLCNRHHGKPPREYHVQTKTAAVVAPVKPGPVNPEILKNAERLAETLRQCKQTAHNNRETQ